MRIDNRANDQLRDVVFTPHSYGFGEGSVLAKFGETTVLCNTSLETNVPKWLKDSQHGWVSAEYAMLPRATSTRNTRESVAGKRDGRSVEISRLVARALRASIAYTKLPPVKFTVDCDVLQADGGTRTTAISGASVSLVLGIAVAKQTLAITSIPRLSLTQAVSVGLVNGECIVDLNYYEDSRAQVDATIITSANNLCEVQLSGEGHRFSRKQLNQLVDSGIAACNSIKQLQQQTLQTALHDLFVDGKEQDLERLLTYIDD